MLIGKLILETTTSMPEPLSRAKCWYLDATFRVVKQLFVQLFQFIPSKDMFPPLFVLMSRCRRNDYELVLNEVCKITPITLWVSIPSMFTEACLIGCVFQWVQEVWRKIGLVDAYPGFSWPTFHRGKTAP